MRLTNNRWLRVARLTMLCLAVIGLVTAAHGQAVVTTTVQGTIYLANGQPGGGTLTVSWPAFSTAAGQLVAADQTSVTIGNDGFVSINLAPNQGAAPAGQFYTAVFYMSDGSVNTQYWIVPAAAQATLAQVQAQVMPAAQAVQAVSKAYVDGLVAELTGSLLTASGGNLSGPLFLNGDPTQPLQAADKHYVDSQVSTAIPLAGGNMSGPLTTPGVNGIEVPAGSQQSTLQAAMNAAGANGAMEIPPTYAGTDTFANPNGVRVVDMRTSVAQQVERSVKEFGAVCDGVTDDTSALQSAINYAQAHGVALTIPEGTCKTRTLNWHGESIGGLGKQVSALMGFPGQDVLATTADNPNILSYTRLHDLTIYVDQSQDVSCSQAVGRAAAGSCQLNRPMESNTIFSPGGNGLTGTAGSGNGWAVGNCGIAMLATTGAGGNGLKNAQIENLEIVSTGTDPMAAQYPGAHSTHSCGLYLAQWPQWSEFKNIDIRGLNTGIAIPALPVATPAGLLADSNRWQNITIQATHGFTAAAGCNDILDDLTAMAGNSAATGEPPTGIVLDLASAQEGWTVRNTVVMPSWNAVQPALTVTAASGAVAGVTLGTEHGLGWDPYGTTVPVTFSGSCTAQANATVNTNGSISAINVTQGGSGCSSTTTASINAPGNWDTAAPVNLIGGQNMTFFAGSMLRGHGGYTVWNATGAQSYGTQVNGGGGNLPGGGSYPAFIANNSVGSTLQVDQFPGANFGAKLQACVNAVNTNFGGICDARNFTGSQTVSANLTISTPNTTVLLPCATITTTNQVIVTAGTRNVALRGCAMRGGSTASGSQGGTAFAFSGAGAVIQVGDPTYTVDTPGFHMDNSVINTTGSTNATAQGLVTYRTQEIDLEDMYFLGNSNQTGMTLDGTGNYAGGTIRSVQFDGFGIAVNAIGHQVANPATTDWMNASTFVRLHIDCPTSNSNPIAGTIGINLQQGDGNTFTGGDVEGCATALHLGSNAQNNTIIGLRNENSTSQVMADAGSSYNNWITGGTMFTGQLTDNGTRNSFQDTFHRSFNGINGDWYGSQQDATVTNHFRLGTGAGNERGLLNEYQTDSGYRWTEGLSDATGGEQFYQILDQLNNVYRLSIGQYNNGQSSTNNQTAMNSAGTGAVVLNSTSHSGTGGVIFGSGGATPTTVATVNNSGNAQFNGTLQVGGTAQSTGTMTVRNNADAEVDYYLWPGLTTSQKGSFTYKDWNGNSQWYMLKDSTNNWALNSALGGLDSFKAYQSTNSGDTYINASNSSGHIRLNYESGSGAETDIYSGSSSNLVASFLGPTSIKLPGLASSSGHYCLQIDNSGYITNTGIACGTGSGNGTVSSGSSGQIAYYTSSGTTIAGVSAVPVAAGGTGSTSASGAMANLLPGVATDGNQGIMVAGAAAAATANFGQNNGSINASSCGLSTAPAWCPGGTDGGAWANAAIAQVKQNTFNSIANSYGVVSLDPTQGIYSVSTPIVVPYGVIFDCKGAAVNWAGTVGSTSGGHVAPNGPFILAGVWGNGNPRGVLRNCHISNHGQVTSQYQDTVSGSTNYTFGVLLGGDPNGNLVPSTDWASNFEIYGNSISGFNAGIAIGNASITNDIKDNNFNGNLNAVGDGTLFPCGGGIAASGELLRISGGQMYGNAGNGLALHCNDTYALSDTSVDYSDSKGWMTAVSTAYLGAPAPSNPILQSEIAGAGVQVSAVNVHLEQFYGPLFQPSNVSTLAFTGGMMALQGNGIVGESYYCQITGAHTAIFSIQSTGYGPTPPTGTYFQVASSTCASANGVQFTGATTAVVSISSTNYISVTGTTTATLTVTAQQADTGTFTQDKVSPTYCAITNPSTGLYIANITVANDYNISENFIPSGLTTCSVLNGQTLRTAQYIQSSSLATSATQLIADVSAVAGVGVVSGSETGSIAKATDTGYIKTNHGSYTGGSTVISTGTRFNANHPVTGYCDISLDSVPCAIIHEQSAGLFGGTNIQNLKSLYEDGTVEALVKTSLGSPPIMGGFINGGSGIGTLALSAGLAGANCVSAGAGTGTSPNPVSNVIATLDFCYGSGTPYGGIGFGLNRTIVKVDNTGLIASVPVLGTYGTQTIAGCSLSTAVGGASAGSFKSGTSGACAVTITPGTTAPHGFRCSGTDTATGAYLAQTGYTATTCSLSGTTTSADLITWSVDRSF